MFLLWFLFSFCFYWQYYSYFCSESHVQQYVKEREKEMEIRVRSEVEDDFFFFFFFFLVFLLFSCCGGPIGGSGWAQRRDQQCFFFKLHFFSRDVCDGLMCRHSDLMNRFPGPGSDFPLMVSVATRGKGACMYHLCPFAPFSSFDERPFIFLFCVIYPQLYSSKYFVIVKNNYLRI